MNEAISKKIQHAAEVAATCAVDVDAKARFPSESIEALRAEGLLGLLSAEEMGGLGLGFGDAARVVEQIARECASTAMVLTMHYAGTAVIEKLGPTAVRKEIAAGRNLTTLAFSESGSRSHFWAPVSSAKKVANGIQLDAQKSFATSASQADSYVWSSRPLGTEGMSTLWLVRRETPGIQPGRYQGLGLRGNDSAPVRAEAAVIPADAMLGADGSGFDTMMGIVLPLFNLCNAACSIGLTEGALNRAIAHASSTRYQHLDSSLADLPTIRAYLARARIQADSARTLWQDAIAALESGRADTMLRVLQVKAAANETAISVTQECMRVSGGAAYRPDVGLERYFRDARAGFVMAPTSDQLYDFIGKAICGLPLF
jgi:alkylation response protein AidB-like acyl-CoA dehydrogenase